MQLGRGCKSDPLLLRDSKPILCCAKISNIISIEVVDGLYKKKIGRAHKGRLSFVVNYEKISSLEFVGPCFYDHRSLLRGSSANGT